MRLPDVPGSAHRAPLPRQSGRPAHDHDPRFGAPGQAHRPAETREGGFPGPQVAGAARLTLQTDVDPYRQGFRVPDSAATNGTTVTPIVDSPAYNMGQAQTPGGGLHRNPWNDVPTTSGREPDTPAPPMPTESGPSARESGRYTSGISDLASPSTATAAAAVIPRNHRFPAPARNKHQPSQPSRFSLRGLFRSSSSSDRPAKR
ncbi:hypothetical protein [Micromonospora sp. SH-82]|uniref:hypothetical protein n=1 Tax=Micromonospora sp. SH-82 TaxID=3132938 RepID=UPI003EC0071E